MNRKIVLSIICNENKEWKTYSQNDDYFMYKNSLDYLSIWKPGGTVVSVLPCKTTGCGNDPRAGQVWHSLSSLSGYLVH